MRPLMPPVQTPDNLFHDGNPLTGELGTIVDAEHLNNVQGAVRDAQSELITVLTAAGINVDPTKQNQLLTALKALLLSRSNPFGDIKSDGAAAIATALTNLQLGEAAKRDVGSGAGQVPDMSSFQSGGGWFKLPSGYVIQAFEASFDSNGLYINFPIPFPSSVIAIVPGVLMSTTASPSQQFPSIQRDVNDLTRFFAKYNMGGMNASYFIAIGK
ncbi:gp53-like domain-containing protein [Citrobacter freundii]|uniref:gp53-like domain-containing protein n=1 Tax=Citrobacter freundii TaxID=546 RepID=UPI0028BDB536|nr:hypothetical protein [Citrobacter freundii]MDT7417242.1 hypothetical protein [Citrobacter freundii]